MEGEDSQGLSQEELHGQFVGRPGPEGRGSRREEQNFLRTIMAYGVEYSSKEARFVWDR